MNNPYILYSLYILAIIAFIFSFHYYFNRHMSNLWCDNMCHRDGLEIFEIQYHADGTVLTCSCGKI